MKKRIAVDCDEVLSETVESLLKYHKNIYNGKWLEKKHITGYALHELPEYKASIEYSLAYFKEFFLSEAAYDIDPVAGAFEKLSLLKNEGFDLVVLTARIEEDTKEMTETWIETFFPNMFSEIYYASHFGQNHKEKSEICHNISADVMIEDNVSYALDTANAGIKTFLLEKPWNSAYIVPQNVELYKVPTREDIILP